MGRATDGLRQRQDDELGKRRYEGVQRRLDVHGIFNTALGTAQVVGKRGMFPAPADEARNLPVGVLGAVDQMFCVRGQNAVPNLTDCGLSHSLSNVADARLAGGQPQNCSDNRGALRRAVAQTLAVRGVTDE